MRKCRVRSTRATLLMERATSNFDRFLIPHRALMQLLAATEIKLPWRIICAALRLTEQKLFPWERFIHSTSLPGEGTMNGKEKA